MRKLTYFAVFEPVDTGFSVYFPDLSGCISMGTDFNNALDMATEALGLHIWGMEADGDELPEPTSPPFDSGAGAVVSPVTIFPGIVKNTIESRAVKKTLSIPFWLNELAEEQNVNFSSLLQNALRDKLNV